MKTEYTKLQKLLELVGLILILLFIGFIAMSWGGLPDKIPGHYNAAGVVDRWGDKWEIIMLPIITIILYAGLSVISLFPQLWNVPQTKKESNKYLVYSTVKTMLILMKVELVANFFLINYFSVKGMNIPALYTPVFLIVIFVSLIYYTWKSYRQAKM
ncbi:DUF1648 domain-containing protein [Clostridium sp.]|uniref:DUF1648 domain-containing protein n=1 Tax=Clostridium sp. TaxID=1506 RepID=UPI00261A790C|nr:DUF1648 domain-containing protein [Clostridium sp.]